MIGFPLFQPRFDAAVPQGRRLSPWIVSALVVLATGSACRRATNAGSLADADLVEVHATVKRFQAESEVYLLVADSTGAQYVPDRSLPASLRVDGLRVVFSARSLEIPANVRMAGAPVRILQIRRLDDGRHSRRVARPDAAA